MFEKISAAVYKHSWKDRDNFIQWYSKYTNKSNSKVNYQEEMFKRDSNAGFLNTKHMIYCQLLLREMHRWNSLFSPSHNNSPNNNSQCNIF